MPALAITLNQLAAALLGAGAYIYHTGPRSGWNACAIVCGTRIERSSPDPYAALAAVAATLVEYEAQQTAQDAHDSPAARAAYRQAWAASEGQPVADRFAAAEAAAAATESAGWPAIIRTEQDNARTMQRLRSITGRPSDIEAAPGASGDEQSQPAAALSKKERAEAKRQELVAWLIKNGGRKKWQVCRIEVPQHLQGYINGMMDEGRLIREYKTGKGFMGKYKRCYLRLNPNQQH
jgi:hypothetical protein